MVNHSVPVARLRQRTRRLTAWLVGAVLAWWVALIVLAGWAPGLLTVEVGGPVNVGHLLVLAQIVTTLGVTQFYLWYARTRLDPLADDVKGDRHAG